MINDDRVTIAAIPGRTTATTDRSTECTTAQECYFYHAFFHGYDRRIGKAVADVIACVSPSVSGAGYAGYYALHRPDPSTAGVSLYAR